MQPNIYLMIGDNYINETSNVSSKQEEFKRSNIHIYIYIHIYLYPMSLLRRRFRMIEGDT